MHNLRRTVFGIAVGIALITATPITWPIEYDDDEDGLPSAIEVWGEYAGGAIGASFGPFASSAPDYRFSDTGLNQGDPTPGVAAFSNRLQDARCYGYAPFSTSASTHSFDARRQMAATMLQHYAYGSFAVGTLPVGTRFPVIYGDGGSEVWIVFTDATGLPSSVGSPHNLMGPGSWATPTPAACNVG